MAKSKEELKAHAISKRAEIKAAMSPDQRRAHEEAVARKEAAKAAKIQAGRGLSSEFEQSIDRSLTRFLEALEGVERHHGRSWLTSVVCQDFASAFDNIRGMVHDVREVKDE